MTERTAYWDDWVMTCGEPSVWCGFDWPVMAKSYVVYPQPRCPVCACIRDYQRPLYPCTHPGCPERDRIREEQEAERRADERRQLENEAMAEHFRKHPHG